MTFRLTVVVSLLLGLTIVTGPAGAGIGERRTGNAEDPTDASVLISEDLFGDDGGADGALVATSATFADALAGTALAGTTRPILFTDPAPAPLRPEVLDELQRAVGPAQGCGPVDDTAFEVGILGGTAAVSIDAAQAIEDAGYCVRRFAGVGREQTAIEVAETVLAATGDRDRTTVMVARRDNVVDAATGGAFGAFSQTPVVVTPPELLHPDVEAFLAGVQPDEIIILGGTAAISADVEQQLATLARTVRRIAGPSREDTAVAIATELWPADIDTVVLVNGFSDATFVYALAAGPLAAAEGAPQLYTRLAEMPAATIAYLAQRDTTTTDEDDLPDGAAIVQILAGPPTEIGFQPGEGFPPPDVPPGLPFIGASARTFGTGQLHFTPNVRETDDFDDLATVVTEGASPPNWAPDHRTVFYAEEITNTQGEAADVIALDPETGQRRVVFTGRQNEIIFNAVPSPDGRLLAIDGFLDPQGNRVSVVDLTADPPQPIARDVVIPGAFSTFLPSRQPWTPDSQSLLIADPSDGAIGLFDVASGQHRPLPISGDRAAHSPQEDRIAVRHDDGITVLSSSGAVQVSIEANPLVTPLFSGDGRFLLAGDGRDALRCPAGAIVTQDCERIPSERDGWAGAATISPGGDVMIAEAEPFSVAEGYVVIDLREEPRVVSFLPHPFNDNTFAPAVPTYCPIGGGGAFDPITDTSAFATCP